MTRSIALLVLAVAVGSARADEASAAHDTAVTISLPLSAEDPTGGLTCAQCSPEPSPAASSAARATGSSSAPAAPAARQSATAR